MGSSELFEKLFNSKKGKYPSRGLVDSYLVPSKAFFFFF